MQFYLSVIGCAQLRLNKQAENDHQEKIRYVCMCPVYNLSGLLGQFQCGNKRCEKQEGLKSWEVNFAYVEVGEKRNALVKLSKRHILFPFLWLYVFDSAYISVLQCRLKPGWVSSDRASS